MQWGGAAVEEGWRGGAVAQARARGWLTGDGGATVFCGDHDDGAGVPANECVQNRVREVRKHPGVDKKRNGGKWCGVVLATSEWIWSGPRKNAARVAHWKHTGKRGCDGVVEWSEESGVAQGFGLGWPISPSGMGVLSAMAWHGQGWPLGDWQRWHGTWGQDLWLMCGSRRSGFDSRSN